MVYHKSYEYSETPSDMGSKSSTLLYVEDWDSDNENVSEYYIDVPLLKNKNNPKEFIQNAIDVLKDKIPYTEYILLFVCVAKRFYGITDIAHVSLALSHIDYLKFRYKHKSKFNKICVVSGLENLGDIFKRCINCVDKNGKTIPKKYINRMKKIWFLPNQEDMTQKQLRGITQNIRDMHWLGKVPEKPTIIR